MLNRPQLVRRLLAALALAVGAGIALLGMAAVASATPPKVFNPVQEAQNFSITQQRQRIYDTPQYQAQLAVDSQASTEQALATEAADPGRFFTDDLCWNLGNGCAGDIRLNNWANNGYGLVRPVLFTARNGATISGHVWATVAGPAKRPGVVITNGSVQADEQMYWYAAQTLAKEGYVVLTFDPQGQGQSDTYGEGADRNEGFPAQSTGTPFFDGTEDAINFFLSSPKHPYEPVKSCTTGTSHAAKQKARVKEGFDAAYNPFYSLLNTKELGLAGHSYGAAGVSYIGEWDPRVKAIVAWDNLGGPSPNSKITGGPSGTSANVGEAACPANPAARKTVPITKPALGMSADYFLPPTPNTSLPDPNAKSTWSHSYTKAGVDTGEIIIRGGSHLDFSFIPNQAFGASYYGPDFIDWYTTAWFDKYLKHQAGADNMLLSQRWRDYRPEAAIDPNHDGNAFSFYYYSRLDIHRAGGARWDCEDLRDGCPGMVPTSQDGYKGNYSYFAIDTSPDSVHGPGAPLKAGNGLLKVCPSATGRITSTGLGLVRLGMTRKRVERVLARKPTRTHRFLEFFCLSNSGIRTGYPSPKLLRSVPRRERGRLRGRVVMVLTANRHYAVRGVRAGSRLALAHRRLKLTRAFHVGQNYWYLARYRSGRVVLKVRKNRVQEIGIANRRLTRTATQDSRFLRTFF